MKRKQSTVILSAAMAAMMLMSGCGKDGGSAQQETATKNADGKYEPTLTITIAKQLDENTGRYGDGEDINNNPMTRLTEEKLGLKMETTLLGGDASNYDTKLRLALTGSEKLPDIFPVYGTQMISDMIESGQVKAIDDDIEKYMPDRLKEIYDKYPETFYPVTKDGKTYGIACTPCMDAEEIMVIRQDWLDKLGLEVPKTVDELGEVAQKFKDAGLSPDYAIAGIDNGGRTYSNFLNSSNNGYGFDAVYQAFNATPGYFLKDDSGELYWGTTTDEMKEALTTLHDWYEKGLINPEVGTTTNGDNANNVKNGTCGIFMGPWWSLGYGNPDSFRNDNNANWQAYPLYTKDGEWNIHMKDVGTTYTMVNKNASDDVKKAIVIMNNVLVRDESTFDTSVAIGWYPLRNTMAATDECEYEYDALMGIIKGEASADDYQQGGSKFNGLYKNLANDAATLKDVISEDYDGSRDLTVTDMDVNTNNGQFNRFYALLIGDRPYATLEPDHKIYSELYYTIDGMDTYWTQISDLEDKSVLQFITGAKSLDEWDQFCTDWHVQGGDQILELVKDYLAE